VYEYPHTGGACVVIGGDVYRGSAIPALVGDYVFADFCVGTLQALRVHPDGSVEHFDLGATLPDVSSFGTDANGELDVTSLEARAYRVTGGCRPACPAGATARTAGAPTRSHARIPPTRSCRSTTVRPSRGSRAGWRRSTLQADAAGSR